MISKTQFVLVLAGEARDLQVTPCLLLDNHALAKVWGAFGAPHGDNKAGHRKSLNGEKMKSKREQ